MLVSTVHEGDAPDIFCSTSCDCLTRGKIIGLFHLTSHGDLTFQIACLSVLNQYPMGSFYADSRFVPYLLWKLKNSLVKQMSCVVKERPYVTVCPYEVYKVRSKLALSWTLEISKCSICLKIRETKSHLDIFVIIKSFNSWVRKCFPWDSIPDSISAVKKKAVLDQPVLHVNTSPLIPQPLFRVGLSSIFQRKKLC